MHRRLMGSPTKLNAQNKLNRKDSIKLMGFYDIVFSNNKNCNSYIINDNILSVLVVDDDQLNLQAVEKLFKLKNVKVLCASNGYEAMAIVEKL